MFLVILVFLIFSCDPLCGNYILFTKNIKDTEYKIVVFERDCGATTGFSTQASILKINEDLPNEPGNIFTSNTDHGKAPSGKGGGPELRVSVLDNNHIQLAYHEYASIGLCEKMYKNIKISYITFK